jgi:hypothetical protein
MAQLQVPAISEDRVDVGHGISVPRSWEAIVTEWDELPGTLEVRVTWDDELNRAVAEKVSLQRPNRGTEVTSVLLRQVRVQTVVTLSTYRVATVHRGSELEARAFLKELGEKADRTLGETLVDAAAVYRLASVANDAPLKVVAETLGVSQSSATRFMARARLEGLAPDFRPPVDPYATGPYVGPDSSGPSIGR